MNKLYLMKRPELFQGEKYLHLNKRYFEGWYFKNTNKDNGISFIPGINIEGKKKKAFIQVITNKESYFVNYNIEDFKFNFEPFYIKIKDNIFSKEGLKIEILDDKQNLKIDGKIKYTNSKNISVSAINPNIMGPFSYVPFMECNHAILSMKNITTGSITINNRKIDFNNGIGYIEKDWGCSFPKSYIWCQGNNFKNSEASFMISIANIPFKLFEFRGIIATLIIGDKEFKFTTYNNAKLIEYIVGDNSINITLERRGYILNIKSQYNEGLKLSAPVKGKMERDVFESIYSTILVTLKKNNTLIFSDTSKNCGVEIAK